MVENEEDDFKRIKMRIQKDVLLTLQQVKDGFFAPVLIVFAHFGLSFKKDFIQLFYQYNRELHDHIFKDGDFITYSLERSLEQLQQYEKSMPHY